MCRCNFLNFFFLIIVAGCSPKTQVSKVQATEYSLSSTSNNTIDSGFYYTILPYREKLSGEMTTVLAESNDTLEKGIPEGKLGNFIADLCLEETNKNYYPTDNHLADFAFLNNGGLRRSLPKGKITRGDIYELMPFENELVVLTMDGQLVKKIFNFMASIGGAPVSGCRFEISANEAVNIQIHNEPFDSTRIYKVVTSDYLANGGDKYFFLSGTKRTETIGLKVRDAIIQHLQSMGKKSEIISGSLDGRISNVK